MIQAAITKRLPVFAGGDEGAVFAALFSFLRAVCYDHGRDVVSHLYKWRTTSCVCEKLLHSQERIFWRSRLNDEIIARENDVAVDKTFSSLEIGALKRTAISKNGTPVSLWYR